LEDWSEDSSVHLWVAMSGDWSAASSGDWLVHPWVATLADSSVAMSGD
jgi:hypothetical protein